MGSRSDLPLKSGRPAAEDDPATTKDCDENGDKTDYSSGPPKTSFVFKLMLCAQMLGTEASCNFEQLYTVPLLQTLEMPMTIVSLTGLVEGSVAIIALPLIGWLTDRGSNTLRRKTIAIFLGAGLQVTGMLTIIVANLMHLTSMANFNNNTVTLAPAKDLDELISAGTISWKPSTDSIVDSSSAASRPGPFNVSSGGGKPLLYSNAISGDFEHSSEVPVKAGLGMLGFVLIGLGFDTMNGMVRSFVLAYSPRAEHTTVLVVGLIMGSVGGLSTASLGIVDFTKLFGLSSVYEGGSLTIQTSLQGALVSSFVLLGLLVTTLSGRRQRKLITRYQALPDSHDNDDSSSHPDHDHLTGSSRVAAFESSIRSFAGAGVNCDPALSLLSQSQDFMPQKRRTRSNSEQTPLLSEDNNEAFRDSEEFVQSHVSSTSFSYGSKDSSFLCSGQQQQQQTVAKTPLEDIPENADVVKDKVATAGQRDRFGFKTKLAMIFMSTYFGVGLMMMFTFTGSDFVAKAIYDGNPDAPPGSDSLARYQDGMRAASWGFLLYYGTYMCVSFVHPRVLAKLGCRVEFVATHLLMGMTMLLTSLTQRLEAFYVLAVVAAFHRACFFVVPFAVTNDVINARVSSTGGKANIGLAISVITASMPLAFCSMFPWIGPLEELAGTVAAPLWLGTASGCLAICFMILVGKV